MLIDLICYMLCVLMIILMPIAGAGIYYCAEELWNKHMDRRNRDGFQDR